MRTLLTFALALFASAGLFAGGARAQRPSAGGAPTLNDSERALAAASREAIIRTGLSAAFFDEHFRVQRVVDRPGDRRVVWRLSVGGHETSVNDAVGFYTEGARRVNTHSVSATLNATSDITRAITRRRAEQLMRRCVGGPFTDPQVEYRAHGEEGRAALLLTAARTIPPPPESRAARERRERAEALAARRQEGQGAQERDQLRRKSGAPQPVIRLGAVDLVTGACTVGVAQVGSPKPSQ